MKKALFLFMLILIISVMPVAISEGDFTIDLQTGTVTSYTGNGPDIVIPKTIDGVKVKIVGEWLVNANSNIKSIVIPEGVTHIENSAFYFCDGVEKLSLPSTLESIDEFAFFCTNIKDLEIPDKVVFIGKNAFSGTYSLQNIVFKGELPVLNENAFVNEDNEKREYTVPANELEKYNEALSVECLSGKNCEYYDYLVDERDILVNENGELEKYYGERAYIILPDTVNAKPIVSVAKNAFVNDKLIRRIKLSSSVKSIGDRAFIGSKLVHIEFNEGLESIGENAFAGNKIYHIELPSTLKNIGASAFWGTDITDLSIPEGITNIPEKAFMFGNLVNVYFPSTIKNIGAEAFASNKTLIYLYFSAYDVPEIAEDAFENCELEDVDIPWDATRFDDEKFALAFEKIGFGKDKIGVWRANRVDEAPYSSEPIMEFDEDSGFATKYTGNVERLTMYWNFEDKTGTKLLPIVGIDEGFFKGSNIKEFAIPHSETFTTISNSAFEDSQLESIYLFDSLTFIGENAFKNCKNLKEIKIPDSVTYIGANAFDGTGIEKLLIPAGVELGEPLGLSVDNIRFADNTSDEYMAKYKEILNYPWYKSPLRLSEKDSFAIMYNTADDPNNFEFDKSTGTINKYKGKNNVCVIPKQIDGVDVKTIGSLAFSNLNMYDIVADNEIKDMGLIEVIVPETVTKIEDSAFVANKSLVTFICYGPIEYLGIRAFEECTELKEVVFHNGILNMGGYCFNLASSLEHINLGKHLTTIPEGAFVGNNIKSFAIEAAEVGNLAFQNCANLNKVYITKNVNKIGDAAFNGAIDLESVYFEKADPTIVGSYIFDNTIKNLNVFIPEDSDEKQLESFIKMINENMLVGKDVVKTKPFPKLEYVNSTEN